MTRLRSFLLLGVLAMATGEVMAGSSPGWFYNPWSLLVTFPLYLVHIVLIWSVAVLLLRTRWYQLYLFGMMFALYEAWITKVLWAGYIGESGPLVGSLAGVGIAEFGMLVFWAHPVMSCLVPLFLYQLLSGKVFAEHVSTWQFLVKKQRLVYVLGLATAAMILFGHGFAPVSALITIAGTVCLLWLLWSTGPILPLEKLVASRAMTAILAVAVLGVYVLATLYFLPERLPEQPIAYVPVLATYVIAICLLWRSRSTSSSSKEDSDMRLSSLQKTKFIPLGIGLLLVVGALVPPLTTLLVLVWYWSLVVFGLVLFATVAYRSVTNR